MNAFFRVAGHLRTLARARCAVVLAVLATVAAAASDDEKTGGPYVPTPDVVVEQMLRMAGVGPSDFVVDLGSGDGVIVLTAAKKYKARGFGVDIDAELVGLSNSRAKLEGVADRVAFYRKDIFQTDVSKATVVTLYLLPAMMVNLRPKLLAELKPGTRVVSHDYHFDDWLPDSEITFDVPEKEKVNGVPSATIYLWVVPAQVAGRWQLRFDPGADPQRYDLNLRQRYQVFEGTATAAGGVLKLAQPALRGAEIRFTLPASSGRHRFTGKVAGDTMEGTVQFAGGKGTVRWSATRVPAQRSAEAR
ncbi:MAG: class I SAM-dependent methyltransferase [Betaproteobacteria bacterium]|nr:class I SAM-dependent methyltransferase [Betaproteobacteria bacterium]